MRAVIREGDPTSHGGTVLESFPQFDVYGKNLAGVGHRGHCPRCKKDFVIIAGAARSTYMGISMALEGTATSCGALLIATQHDALVEDFSENRYVGATVAGDRQRITKPFAYSQHFRLVDEETGLPLSGIDDRLECGGEALSGTTDEEGLTSVIGASSSMPVLVFLKVSL